MPLFAFICLDCKFSKEHFLYPNAENLPACPKCGSARYSKKMSRFSVQMEYADNAEFIEKKVDPMVNEVYEKIGKEAMNEDTKTLDNLYGADKVENSISGYDD